MLAISFIIGILIGFFINNQIVHLNVYYINTEDGYLADFKNTITINTVPAENYITHGNVQIGNIPDYFTQTSTFGFITYLHEDEETGFWFGHMPDDDFMTAFINWNELDGSPLSRRAILENRNIKNDNDFLHFLANTRRSNLLSSINRMRENHILHTFVDIYFSYFDGVALVDGDFIGRMTYQENAQELQIQKNNRIYTFTFFNLEYWNDERINRVINSIIINHIEIENDQD